MITCALENGQSIKNLRHTVVDALPLSGTILTLGMIYFKL